VSFTLAQLKAAINEYTQNTNWGSTTQIDTIIKQAEERINYAVQIANYNTKSKSGFLADGSSSLTLEDSETAPLAPIYFRVRPNAMFTASNYSAGLVWSLSTAGDTAAEVAALEIGAGVCGLGVAEGTVLAAKDAHVDTRVELSIAVDGLISRSLGFTDVTKAWSYLLLKDYNFLQEYAPVDSATGSPKYYAFYNDAQDADPSNAATFAFAPAVPAVPSVIYGGTECFDYEVLYFFEPQSLVDVETDTLTWLSTHGTNALLYSCLVEAYTFLKGEQDLMQLYDNRYKEALQTLVMAEQGNYRTTYRSRAA
jgi:hypothetical protein